MGSTQSQFQYRFYSTYNFIQMLNDEHFGNVKIYRKTTFNYDYIMIWEQALNSFDEQYLYSLQEQMKLIKCYQTTNIIRLYQYRIIRENVLNCQGSILRIYSQYYNHTLSDFLIALHSNSMFLSMDQIAYIMKTLTHALICFQKMKIKPIKISLKKIFVSIEGEVMLSPLITIFNPPIEPNQESLNCLPLLPKEKKLSLKQYIHTQFIQKQNLIDIFLQLTSYMILLPNIFSSSQNLLMLIINSRSINQLYEKLPNSQNQCLLTSRLYKENLQTQKKSEDLQR